MLQLPYPFLPHLPGRVMFRLPSAPTFQSFHPHAARSLLLHCALNPANRPRAAPGSCSRPTRLSLAGCHSIRAPRYSCGAVKPRKPKVRHKPSLDNHQKCPSNIPLTQESENSVNEDSASRTSPLPSRNKLNGSVRSSTPYSRVSFLSSPDREATIFNLGPEHVNSISQPLFPAHLSKNLLWSGDLSKEKRCAGESALPIIFRS